MFKRSVRSGVLIVSAIVLGALLTLPLIAQAPGWSCRIHLPPNPYSFHKEDLEKLMWIEIANGEKELTPVYLHGEIKRDGKLVARANSNRIEIPPGGKRITRGDITKLTDEWWDPELEKTLIRAPILPEGKYEACVYVYKWGGKELLTKCCISFESKPVSPPRLIAPKDGATLKEKYPLFQWTPPTPTPKEVTYTLRIVEIRKGQTKEEAMRTNPAWFEKKGIKGTSFKYPITAKILKGGKRYEWKEYAWQVIAFSEGVEVGRSEVWTFSPIQCMCLWCDESGYNHHIGSDGLTRIDANGNGICDASDPAATVIPWATATNNAHWGPCEECWGAMHDAPRNAEWIWENNTGAVSYGECITFVRCFECPDTQVIDACLELSADDSATVWLNGHLIGHHPAFHNPPTQFGTWYRLSAWDVPASFFNMGHNVLKIEVCDVYGKYGGLLYCLHYKMGPCLCSSDSIPDKPDVPPHEPVPCDSFTECCVRLCKGWTTISFPMREYTAPFTTTLEDLIPDASHHSDIGRISNIWWWSPPLNWNNATSWLLNGTDFGSRNWTKGYAVFSNCETEYCIAGIPVREWTTTIYKGWNLIGSVLCDTCPCCCGRPPVGIPWTEPSVTLTDMAGNPLPLTSIIGPYYMCGPWSLVGPVSVIEPFKGYWICTKLDSAKLKITCDSIVPLPTIPCPHDS